MKAGDPETGRTQREVTGAGRLLRLPPLRRAGDILTHYLTAIGGLRDVLGKVGTQHFEGPARDFRVRDLGSDTEKDNYVWWQWGARK